MKTLDNLWTLKLAALLCLLLTEAGCTIPMTTGPALTRERVSSVIPGKTTKKELFELLGAPVAIAVRNETLAVPSPSVWAVGLNNRLHTRGYNQIQSDPFFELFAVRHQFTEYHRVYYYYHSTSMKWFFPLFPVFIEQGTTWTDQLWILVDEKTGLVVDSVFRLMPR